LGGAGRGESQVENSRPREGRATRQPRKQIFLNVLLDAQGPFTAAIEVSRPPQSLSGPTPRHRLDSPIPSPKYDFSDLLEKKQMFLKRKSGESGAGLIAASFSQGKDAG
jgi:hypothetical protein